MIKDLTVKQFIDALKNLDQDSKVCIANMQDDGDGFYYSAIEGLIVNKNQIYITNEGEETISNIVAIY